MIEFKINNKAYKLPSSWYEITFRQYLLYLKYLQENVDLLKIVCVFSGADYEILKKSKIKGLNDIIAHLKFLNTSPDFGDPTPQIGPYKLPINNKKQFDIQFEYLSQFEDMRAIMIQVSKVPKEASFYAHVEAFAKYCAIYLQNIRDKEYDYLKAMDMVDEVKDYLAHEVITNGSFFFIELMTLLNGTEKTSHTTNQPRKNTKRGSGGSKRSSGRML